MEMTEKYTESQHRGLYRSLRVFLESQNNAQNLSTVTLWNRYCDFEEKQPNRNGKPVQITDTQLIMDMLDWLDKAKYQPKEVLKAFGEIDDKLW